MWGDVRDDLDVYGQKIDYDLVCGGCGSVVSMNDSACGACGEEIDWSGATHNGEEVDWSEVS